MGQKIHPRGLRLGIINTWDSRWYAEKDYHLLLSEDFKIRETIFGWNFKGDRMSEKLTPKIKRENRRFSAVSKIEIERKANNITIYINTAKPGVVIGKSGEAIERLTKHLRNMTQKNVDIKIRPIDNPALDANLLAESIAILLEKRFTVRRVIKQNVEKSLKEGALGIKICCAGRLGGAEIARREWYRKGRVPLHTLRANIDYAVSEAFTTYGKIGIKVWIYLGDVERGNYISA